MFFPEWFAFLGKRADLGLPGSPYAINFRSTAPVLSGLEHMNVSTYSCGDTSFGCSCGDCPSSLACSYPEPSPPKKEYCSFIIGFFQVGAGFIHIHSVVCPLQNRIIIYYNLNFIIFTNLKI